MDMRADRDLKFALEHDVQLLGKSMPLFTRVAKEYKNINVKVFSGFAKKKRLFGLGNNNSFHSEVILLEQLLLQFWEASDAYAKATKDQNDVIKASFGDVSTKLQDSNRRRIEAKRSMKDIQSAITHEIHLLREQIDKSKKEVGEAATKLATFLIDERKQMNIAKHVANVPPHMNTYVTDAQTKVNALVLLFNTCKVNYEAIVHELEKIIEQIDLAVKGKSYSRRQIAHFFDQVEEDLKKAASRSEQLSALKKGGTVENKYLLKLFKAALTKDKVELAAMSKGDVGF